MRQWACFHDLARLLMRRGLKGFDVARYMEGKDTVKVEGSYVIRHYAKN